MVINYVFSGVIAILCGVIILQSILHHCERKDLYDRIMCRNLAEYKGNRRSAQSAHDRVVKKWRGMGGDSE